MRDASHLAVSARPGRMRSAGRSWRLYLVFLAASALHANAQQGRQIRMDVAPAVAEVDQAVEFMVKVAGWDRQMRFRFHFGDDSPSEWLPEPEATHAYTTSGTFTVSVEVGWEIVEGNYATVRLLPQRAERTVEVRPRMEVLIELIGPAPRAGDVAQFEIRTNRSDVAPLFSVDFGHNSSSIPAVDNHVAHAFAMAGTYTVVVTAVAPNLQAHGQTMVTVMHGPLIWPYVLLGILALVAAAHGAQRWAHARPSFHARSNLASIEAHCSSGELVRVELRLVRDPGRCRALLTTVAGSLIATTTKTNE